MNLQKFQKKLLFLAVIAFSVLTVTAQTEKLTLEEAINMALENNTETQNAKLEVSKAYAAVDEAYGYALPSVDLSANFAHYVKKPKMPFPDFQTLLSKATYGILQKEGLIQTNPMVNVEPKYVLQSFALSNNYTAEVSVSQVLFNSAVFRGIGTAGTYLETSQEALKSQAVKTIFNVKKGFYSVLLLEQRLDVVKASLENGEENVANVRALNKQGLVSDFDLMQAEVNVENLRPMVKQLENALKTAKEGLKISIGMNMSTDVEIQGKIDYNNERLPDIDESISMAQEENFDIRTMGKKLEVDEAIIDLDRAEYWPTIAAFGNYKFAGSADDMDFQNYQESMVGLQFSINLFKGFRTNEKVQQSTIALQQSKAQFNQLKDYINMQVKDRINEMERVKTTLNAQERNVELAKRAYELATIRYKEGTGSQLEIQNADMALTNAKVNKLQAVYDYLIAKFELEKLLGKVEKSYLDKVFEFNNNN